jgi:hypothetical protein
MLLVAVTACSFRTVARNPHHTLQAEYAAWHDALLDSLRDTATAEALQEILDLDLDALIAIVPPHGYGRDRAPTKSTHAMKSPLTAKAPYKFWPQSSSQEFNV